MSPETNSFAEHLTPQERRMEEIVLEFLKAQDAGRQPDRPRLLAENPDLASELRAFFADQDDLNTLVRPLGGLTPPPADLPAQVGDYAILEKIGGGGMGDIFKAKQLSAGGRVVALKMIRDREFSAPETIDRFRREALTVACFDQANIVPVYDVGEYAGLPFFSMKFVEGGSLAQLPPALKGNPPALARVLVKVARAVEYAHQHGILHRDLKPANVLLDHEGAPFVADFGLAKNVTDERAALTEHGAVVGTCAYMSPEQAFAEKRLTTRADVYGLGAILYELLTGRPPFQGRDNYDVINQVRHAEPVRPRALKRKLPRDLESICLKCLRKVPDKRYESAAAVADDLERFLAGRPTKARPVAAAERLLKWAKRKPAVATLTAAVVLTALVGLGGVVAQSRQTERALEDTERTLYVFRLFRIHDAINRGHLDVAQALLEASPPRFRQWEWDCLRHWSEGDVEILRGHDKDVRFVAGSPDGRWIVSGDSDGAVLLWPVAEGSKDPFVLEKPGPTMNGVSAVGFSSDGRRLATAHDRATVRVWDVASRKLLFDMPNAGNLAALSRDGELVAAARAGTARVWQVRDRAILHTFTGKTFDDLAFSPDGRALVTGGYGGVKEVCFWDLQSGTPTRPLRSPVQYWVSLLAFHPSQDQLATTEGSIISLWNKEGPEQQLHRGDSGRLTALSFGGAGDRFLATASLSGMLTVWESNTRKVVFGASRGVPGEPMAAAFLPKDPDHRLVYAKGKNVVIERWQTGRDRARALHHAAPLCGVAFAPDGGLMSVADEEVWRWDPRTGKGKLLCTIARLRPTCLALSRDGTTLAVGSGDQTIHVLDARTGERRHLLDKHTDSVRGLAFNAAGDRLASVSLDTTFVVWDPTRGEPVRNGKAQHPLLSVAFDSDGEHLLVGGENGVLQGWPLQGDESLLDLSKHHENGVTHLAYRRDGGLLATASSDATVLLWDARTHAPLKKLVGHVGTVTGLAFSPDGRRLASSGMDGAVKLWDTDSYQEVLSLGGHASSALAVAFDPAGHRLASAHLDRAVRLWDGAP